MQGGGQSFQLFEQFQDIIFHVSAKISQRMNFKNELLSGPKFIEFEWKINSAHHYSEAMSYAILHPGAIYPAGSHAPFGVVELDKPLLPARTLSAVLEDV